MNRILVLGDSHSNIFERRLIKPLRWLFFNSNKFIVYCVPGATISGIENPNSKTQTKNIFDKALIENKSCTYCIIHIGEVDTGYVLWYKSEKEGIDINELLDLTFNRMKNLIQNVINNGYKPIVISTPLPTIQDGFNFGEIANFRKEIKAGQRERTELTIKFNNRVSEFCSIQNSEFVNLDPISLGSNGVVRSFLRNTDKSNHHYNAIIYALVLFYYLKKKIL